MISRFILKLNEKIFLINFRTTIINHGARPTQTELPMLTYDPSTAESTALAVFNQGGNAEYPYDSGLYFYPEEANLEYDLVEDIRNNITEANEENQNNEGVIEEIANPEPPEMPSEAIQIVFVSMWYWWQEIVLISLVNF